MIRTFHLLKGWQWTALILLPALVVTGVLEKWMGRLLFGPDGRFGWWEGDIWSSENSQRLADPYSFSHIIHGMAFYGLLWLAARKLPSGLTLRNRFLIAILLEAGWELLENSPIIINRYRAVTISLGYEGDSILNSLSDIVMMALGFFLAWRLPVWVVIAAIVLMEAGCAIWIRDNLLLNIVMLVDPVEAIKQWQLAGRPHP